MPPCASGPVFTVSRPRRNGSAWATAGAGKRDNAAAAPAALPANMVRRLTLRAMVCSPLKGFARQRAYACQSSALRQCRIVARINWMREIFLLGPTPELTDVLIRLDGLVPELQAIFCAFLADA